MANGSSPFRENEFFNYLKTNTRRIIFLVLWPSLAMSFCHLDMETVSADGKMLLKGHENLMAGILEGCPMVFNKIFMTKALKKEIHFPWHHLGL